MRRRPSAITETLQCPRCAVRVDGFDPEVFRGIQECYKRRCQQHWWAMRFAAGPVLPQLAQVFGPDLAPALVRTWRLPESVDRPVFWQLALSQVQTAQLRQTGSPKFLRLVTTLVQLNDAALVSVAR